MTPTQSVPPTASPTGTGTGTGTAPATRVSADAYRHEYPFASDTHYYFFTSADGGYLCGIDAKQAACQGPTDPLPPELGKCSAPAMVVDTAKKGTIICAGGLMYVRGDNQEPTARDALRPGQAISAFGFTCEAADAGIRCASDASGHGFFIAPTTNERL